MTRCVRGAAGPDRARSLCWQPKWANPDFVIPALKSLATPDPRSSARTCIWHTHQSTRAHMCHVCTLRLLRLTTAARISGFCADSKKESPLLCSGPHSFCSDFASLLSFAFSDSKSNQNANSRFVLRTSLLSRSLFLCCAVMCCVSGSLLMLIAGLRGDVGK